MAEGSSPLAARVFQVPSRSRHRSSIGSGGPSTSPTPGGDEERHLRDEREGIAAEGSDRLHRARPEERSGHRVAGCYEVLAHGGRVRARAEPPAEPDEALLALTFHIVERVTEAPHRLRATFPEWAVALAPRGFDEKPGPRAEGRPVEGCMERKWPSARFPPFEDGAVLRACVPVVVPTRKPELDVVSRQLSHRIAQVAAEVVGLRVIIGPRGVSLLAVGVDVRHDPPLDVPDPRILRGETAEIRSEVAEEARPDRLVRVASPEEAHGAPTLPEPEPPDRPPFPRSTEYHALVGRDTRGRDQREKPSGSKWIRIRGGGHRVFGHRLGGIGWLRVCGRSAPRDSANLCRTAGSGEGRHGASRSGWREAALASRARSRQLPGVATLRRRPARVGAGAR